MLVDVYLYIAGFIGGVSVAILLAVPIYRKITAKRKEKLNILDDWDFMRFSRKKNDY